jgi:hypothetical protein
MLLNNQSTDKHTQVCWCIPCTQKTEAGKSPVQGQPGLHSETLSQNKQTNKVIYLKHFKLSL